MGESKPTSCVSCNRTPVIAPTAVEAAWRRAANRLQPLAVTAAEAAAGPGSSRGSSSLSQAQYTSLTQVAEDVEKTLGRSAGLPDCAVSWGVPKMLFEAVSGAVGADIDLPNSKQSRTESIEG